MITFRHSAFELWRRWNRHKRRARHATAKHAMRALFHLNRAAYVRKRTFFSDKVYAIKSDFIRYWYQSGKEVVVTKQKQVLTCSFCGGDGIDPYDTFDDNCRKCEGTGIYRITTLIKFDFGRYVWHQPEPLCNWMDTSLVPWDQESDFKEQPRGDERFSGDRLFEWWFAVIFQYLQHQGVDMRKHELITLSNSVRFTAPRWWKQLKRNLRQRRLRRDTSPDIPF